MSSAATKKISHQGSGTGSRPHFRIGGVPEHFNLPWRLAIEEGLFERALGCSAEWIDFPGGTASIMAALAAGELDIATPLTEGAVTAIANGNPSKLVRLWTRSPLLWGIHVAGGTISKAKTVKDLDEDPSHQRFAISRFGSGSDLMSRVLIEERGWEDGQSGESSSSSEKWVVVKNLAGALKALPEGKADIFLWNKSMTQPHCDDGTFRRVGVLPTPWPAFVVAVRDGCDIGLVDKITTVALARAAIFRVSRDAVSSVMNRFGLVDNDAQEWLNQVEYEAPAANLDIELLSRVTERMASLRRIEHPIEISTSRVRSSCVCVVEKERGSLDVEKRNCANHSSMHFANGEPC